MNKLFKEVEKEILRVGFVDISEGDNYISKLIKENSSDVCVFELVDLLKRRFYYHRLLDNTSVKVRESLSTESGYYLWIDSLINKGLSMNTGDIEPSKDLKPQIELLNTHFNDFKFLDTSNRGALVLKRIFALNSERYEEAVDYLNSKYVYHQCYSENGVYLFSGYTSQIDFFSWANYLYSMKWITGVSPLRKEK